VSVDAGRFAEYLKHARPWFEEWRSPDAFGRRLYQINRLMDGEFLFNRQNLQWYREALTLVDYAKLIGPHRIRLTSQVRPDAYVIWDTGSAVPIEITEVMEPGRIRGHEYRPQNRGLKFDPVENWHKRLDAIPIAIREAIQKKERRNYPAHTTLLVYLNISGHGVRQPENPSDFGKTVEVRRDRRDLAGKIIHQQRDARMSRASASERSARLERRDQKSQSLLPIWPAAICLALQHSFVTASRYSVCNAA
jgi:hypothetical protein